MLRSKSSFNDPDIQSVYSQVILYKSLRDNILQPSLCFLVQSTAQKEGIELPIMRLLSGWTYAFTPVMAGARVSYCPWWGTTCAWKIADIITYITATRFNINLSSPVTPAGKRTMHSPSKRYHLLFERAGLFYYVSVSPCMSIGATTRERPTHTA